MTFEEIKKIAHGIALQFGSDCEVVIHDLSLDLEKTLAYIENSNVTGRKVGDGPSHVVLEVTGKDPSTIEDRIGYLTRTRDGRILKSSTIYFRDESGAINYILSINYDITNLLAVNTSIKGIIDVPADPNKEEEPERIVRNVNDLLDDLIEESVARIGKPVALMNKDEKVLAIQFLNDAGAFLITKSGDKVSKYFGISKYTLYSYIDVNNNKSK